MTSFNSCSPSTANGLMDRIMVQYEISTIDPAAAFLVVAAAAFLTDPFVEQERHPIATLELIADEDRLAITLSSCDRSTNRFNCCSSWSSSGISRSSSSTGDDRLSSWKGEDGSKPSLSSFMLELELVY